MSCGSGSREAPRDGRTDPADVIDAEVADRDLRIAEGFTALAAIRAGVITSASMTYELPGHEAGRSGGIVTDDQFRVRSEARASIARLVKDSGGQMVTRPLIRSEPHGRTTREPEPLAGITAARALERAARWYCLESIRYAREDGLSWRETGAAFGPGLTTAEAAYRYASPGHDHGDYFLWTCPACGGNIRDYGPEVPLREAEQGHAENCSRWAAAVRAWDAEWEDER